MKEAFKKAIGFVDKGFQYVFRIRERRSSYLSEIRAGCVLFMTSAYILFLNPLILSGGTSVVPTGMPKDDVLLATAIATGLGTAVMGVVGNYPWVVSVQLGTNSYFVGSVLQPGEYCGAHSTFQNLQNQTTGQPLPCAGQPCTCSKNSEGQLVVDQVESGECPSASSGGPPCLGTKIPYEQALAATFLEGVTFLLICLTGLRKYILKLVPRSLLMAGACGIGIFIFFVGLKDSQFIAQAGYPTLLKFMGEWPYLPSGYGSPEYHTGIDFNSCTMYFGGPPFSCVCPWLAFGGLVFTGILLIWNIRGAFIFGILFTTFISWIKFPGRIGGTPPGLVPSSAVAAPVFSETAFSLSFNWSDNPGKLIEAFITFLYLDFIGSSITFVSMGALCGVVNDKGEIPRLNAAFSADASATIFGGLLGSSALTTYVESAAAVQEGGRTGLTAIICSIFFFISIFLAPIFSAIPSIATGPILILIGVIIFKSAVYEINWKDLTDCIPAMITMLGMPFTNNIAYGLIGGWIAFVIAKFVSYQLFHFQKKWPGRALYQRWSDEADKSMLIPVPGWNEHLWKDEDKTDGPGSGPGAVLGDKGKEAESGADVEGGGTLASVDEAPAVQMAEQPGHVLRDDSAKHGQEYQGGKPEPWTKEAGWTDPPKANEEEERGAISLRRSSGHPDNIPVLHNLDNRQAVGF